MTSPAKYHKPFPGRPAPLEMSGLFLFDPTVDAKLMGHSMSGLFAKAGRESLLKGFQRVVNQQLTPSPRLIEGMILAVAGSPLQEDFAAALRGNEEAETKLNGLGLWEAFFLGVVSLEADLKPHAKLLLDIERACQIPLQLIQQNQISEGTDLLLADPLLARFLWPEAVSVLRNVSDNRFLQPLQLAVALEIRLAVLAAWDVSLACDKHSERVTDVLPSPEKPKLNSTALFYHWLEAAAGATSTSQLLNTPHFDDLVGRGALDESTLKRWCRGSHRPDEALLRQVAGALFSDEDYLPLWNRYWASRYLSLLGYLAQTLVQRAQTAADTNAQVVWKPWPKMPFGHPSFEEWCSARYPVWVAYHHETAGTRVQKNV